MRLAALNTVRGSVSGGKLNRSLKWLRIRWTDFTAQGSLKAVQRAQARALKAEADAARLRYSAPRTFLF